MHFARVISEAKQAVRIGVHRVLQPLETNLRESAAGALEYAPVFIVGPPRTGSTLLYQLLVRRYSFCYISNLLNRFPETPLALAKVSKTVERQAFSTGYPVIVTDATMDERFADTESVLNLRLRSILCVPVRGREGPIGTIYLDNRFEKGVFEERQLPLIRAFSDQAALALENARLHEENAHRLEELERAKAEVEELNKILSERIAKTSVVKIRAPLAPIGWPSATAPPRTLTFAGSSPHSLLHTIVTTANASLIS